MSANSARKWSADYTITLNVWNVDYTSYCVT